MKKSMKRTIATVAAAAGIAGGSVVAAAPAQAAVPNLALSGGVYCKFGFTPGVPWTDGIWNMTRYMKVTAQGADFPNVRLAEFGGGEKFGNLKKGQSLEIRTVWRGCFPSSISGYTISSNAENLIDNAGFWWNLRQIDAPAKPAPTQPANNGGGTSALNPSTVG